MAEKNEFVISGGTVVNPGGVVEADVRVVDGMITEVGRGLVGDSVIDATGSHRSMSQALGFCAFAGRLVYVGITHADLGFPHAPILHRRELTLLGSRNALPGDFSSIIAHIEAGRIDPRPWITHRSAFGDMIGEFPSWLKPETGVIKAMVSVD